jgi:hypothetical protein
VNYSLNVNKVIQLLSFSDSEAKVIPRRDPDYYERHGLNNTLGATIEGKIDIGESKEFLYTVTQCISDMVITGYHLYFNKTAPEQAEIQVKLRVIYYGDTRCITRNQEPFWSDLISPFSINTIVIALVIITITVNVKKFNKY